MEDITKKIIENEVKNIWIQTCRHGNATRLSTLYSIYKYPFFTSKEMILLVCKFGHLYILNWMCKINDKLDSDFYHKLFITACEYGHLDILEWLMSFDNKPDIHISNNLPFYIACENGQIGILKYLFSKENIIKNTESKKRNRNMEDQFKSDNIIKNIGSKKRNRNMEDQFKSEKRLKSLN
jgi:hypothetical protein